jgi:hypothetical protein
MERTRILANITSLNAEQLFEEIKEGNVTLKELTETGLFAVTDARYKQILKWQKEYDSKEDEAWENARYKKQSHLSDYITNYPTGKYVQEAKDRINTLEKELRQKQAAKDGILNNIKKNPNKYSPDQIEEYLQNDTITEYDLLECGIPQNIIETISNITPPRLRLGDTPTAIPDGFTEVYFWGIPGSGKTCALAALLSTAHKEGYLNIAIGPGYDYMTRLQNIFIDDTAFLPPPSPVETTQYLPFTLKKVKESHFRSVSLIELSGEIFQCFFYKNAGLELPSHSHVETFDSLTGFLNGSNRKIHFFFIDYDRENKKDSNGYTQSNYLEAAATYFCKPENKVFGKSTDAIYVVLTKSDLMNCSNEELIKKTKEHVSNANFLSFINTLKDNCKKHDINAGRLTVEPFSLGKVYFQQICDFDNSTAKKILDILFDRIKPSKKSILDVFNK